MTTETKSRQIEPDISVIEISGRLGLGNTLLSIEAAIRKLIDNGVRKIIVDIAGLNYIDSAGIGMLVSCHGHMGHQGGRLRIAGAQGLVRESFDIVHIGLIVPLDPDAIVAAAHFSADGASA